MTAEGAVSPEGAVPAEGTLSAGGAVPTDPLDVAPPNAVLAVLALGTNLGDRAGTLLSAVAALRATPGVQVRAVSPVVESDPVGGPDQPDYLNAVVLADTTLSPRALLAACQAVEAAHGRHRAVRWGPRTLDVDIVVLGDLVADAGDLELPHPRAAARAFVLAPWHAADPEAVLRTPNGPRRVADLLEQAPDRGGVRFRPEVRLAVR